MNEIFGKKGRSSREYPPGFSAHWVRVKVDTSCQVTVYFITTREKLAIRKLFNHDFIREDPGFTAGSLVPFGTDTYAACLHAHKTHHCVAQRY
jgi:hypothetical protein